MAELKINCVYEIEGRPVLIIGGAYLRNGRVSNHWNGFYVNEDGTVSDEKWSGYGGHFPQVKCDVVITRKVIFN